MAADSKGSSRKKEEEGEERWREEKEDLAFVASHPFVHSCSGNQAIREIGLINGD